MSFSLASTQYQLASPALPQFGYIKPYTATLINPMVPSEKTLKRYSKLGWATLVLGIGAQYGFGDLTHNLAHIASSGGGKIAGNVVEAIPECVVPAMAAKYLVDGKVTKKEALLCFLGSVGMHYAGMADVAAEVANHGYEGFVNWWKGGKAHHEHTLTLAGATLHNLSTCQLGDVVAHGADKAIGTAKKVKTAFTDTKTKTEVLKIVKNMDALTKTFKGAKKRGETIKLYSDDELKAADEKKVVGVVSKTNLAIKAPKNRKGKGRRRYNKKPATIDNTAKPKQPLSVSV